MARHRSSLPSSQLIALFACLAASILPSHAQTAAAAPEPLYGPVIPGICVFSRDTAIDNSAAGQAATKRMQELTQQVDAELQPEREAIAREQAALDAQKTSVSAPSLKSRSDALAVREQAFNQKIRTRNAQLAKSRQDALAKLTDALRPTLVSVITSNKCSAVLDRTNLYGFNAKLDITPAVAAAMNAVIKPFTFGLAAEAGPAPGAAH
jgi:Skp family chaperone for outer membrane proteins